MLHCRAHPCNILQHLHRDWAHLFHICAGTGLTPATSAPGLGVCAQSIEPLGRAIAYGAQLLHLDLTCARRTRALQGTEWVLTGTQGHSQGYLRSAGAQRVHLRRLLRFRATLAPMRSRRRSRTALPTVDSSTRTVLRLVCAATAPSVEAD